MTDCATCGKGLLPGARFCDGCGAAVSGHSAPEATERGPQAVPGAQAPPMIGSAGTLSTARASSDPPPRTPGWVRGAPEAPVAGAVRKRWWPWAVLVTVLSMVVAGVGLGIAITRDDDSGVAATAPGGYEVRGSDEALPGGEPVLSVERRDDDFLAALGVGTGGEVLSVTADRQPAGPVEVVLPYDVAAVPTGLTPAVFYFDEEASLWLPIDTEADAGRGVLTATTDHFTDFTAGLLDGLLEGVEAGVDVAETGVDWLAFQVASATGARADQPQCADQPSWVTSVTSTHETGFPLSAPLFACAETVAGSNDRARVRVAVNRAYGFQLTVDPATTAMTVEPTAELSGALGRSFSRQFSVEDGTIIAPGTSTVVIEVDRPASASQITVQGHMTATTTLMDALMLTLDAGGIFASGSATEKVEAFECAVSLIKGVGDMSSKDVFLGTWASVVKDCLGRAADGGASAALSRVGTGVSVGLSMGQVGQSFLDRERDLFNGARVQLAVTPAGVALPVGSVTGRWEGPVPQPGARPYGTVLDLIDEGGRLSARVSYPELGCSGTWEQVERTGSRADLQETIDDDPQVACTRLVDISLSLAADGRLAVRYSGSYEALLTRTGPPSAAPSLVEVDRQDLVGDWEGPVDQPGSRPYSLRLQLGVTDEVMAGGVLYPELGCSGQWDEVSLDATTITVREQIDSDPQSTCIPELTATLQLDSAGRIVVDGGNWTAVLDRQPD